MKQSREISVLIAEDDFIISEAIRKEIEDLGYTVVGKASDGRQAVEMTRSFQPDVVIMDIGMPIMDGLAATLQICQTCPTPVVILSAYSSSDLVEQAGKAGAGAYLVKMPNAREVERAVAISIARFNDMMELRHLNAELQIRSDELRRERNFAESLVNTAQVIILVLDMDGRIMRFNPYMEELSGYALAEVQGKDWFSTFLPPRNQSEIRSLFQEAVGNIRTCGNVYPIMTKYGHLLQIEWYDRTLKDADGNVVGLLAVGQDITERQAMEKERHLLEQRRHRVEKAESLSRMAAAVAHHFNNMLLAVMGNLELAQKNLPPDTGITGNLAEARNAALRAAEMGQLMLTYVGQSLEKPETFDLSQICRQHLSQLQEARSRNISIETAFSDPGPVVEIDPARMRQVLTALVNNAGEAMDGFTGTVQVSVNTVEAGEIHESRCFPAQWVPSADTYACLSVTDAGRGMDAETIGKIFDPFYTDKFTGRGLGLAVALGIVKARGGSITVESEPGRGSVFRVFLPLSARNLPRPKEIAKQTLAIEAGVILLVEDEEMVCDVAEAMLEMIGFEVLTAGNGAEAMEIFLERQVDIRLVLSDLSMPRMDGWETLAAIRRIRPDIPVILASGYNEADVMRGKHEERPQAFLQKPYEMKALKDAVEKALGDSSSSLSA